MLDFGATILRALSYLYWLIAIGALALAIYKGKDMRRKVIGAAIVVGIFGLLPGTALVEQHQREAYAKEAWAYFKKLCDERSGEKIYRKVTGVKSVVVIKPLPPATERDLYDQFWYGDPYSNATPWRERGEQGALRLTGRLRTTTGDQVGLDFVEYPTNEQQTSYDELRAVDNYPYQIRNAISHRTSRFAIAWEDVSTIQDRKYWVAASRLQIVDLADQSIVAERLGYFIESGFGSRHAGRRPWLTSRGPATTCPAITNGDFEDRWFVLKVLGPSGE